MSPQSSGVWPAILRLAEDQFWQKHAMIVCEAALPIELMFEKSRNDKGPTGGLIECRVLVATLKACSDQLFLYASDLERGALEWMPRDERRVASRITQVKSVARAVFDSYKSAETALKAAKQ